MHYKSIMGFLSTSVLLKITLVTKTDVMFFITASVGATALVLNLIKIKNSLKNK